MTSTSSFSTLSVDFEAASGVAILTLDRPDQDRRQTTQNSPPSGSAITVAVMP